MFALINFYSGAKAQFEVSAGFIQKKYEKSEAEEKNERDNFIRRNGDETFSVDSNDF